MAFSKKSLDQKLCVRRAYVYQVISSLAGENAHYFRSRRVAYGDRIGDQCVQILRHLRRLERNVNDVSAAACKFDIDDFTPGNGYRSMVAVVDMCLLHLIRLLGRISEQRASLMFLSGHYCRELEAYTAVLGVLKAGIMYAKKFMSTEPGVLFPADEDPDLEAMMDEVEILDQKCFYGRCMGFQFCSSLMRPFQIISVGMAAFSDGFAFYPQGSFNNGGVGLVRTAVSVLNSGKYIINPERRAERIVHVTRHASIEFCKAFWNITETDFLRQLSSIQCPVLAVNELLFIPYAGQAARLSLPRGDSKVYVPLPSCHTGPRPVQIRLLSKTLRTGMPNASDDGCNAAPKSSCLLLHCHGGGFVAQSSKSHEGYLKYWAKSLDVPVVSVDYAKAPENPYPRGQDEVLYTFAWLINNSERVGWTGEKIVLTGDSAGGNLVITTTLRLISMGVTRLPDALVLTYTAFLVRYVPSPSRFLSLMDPLLPLGILARCMAAYTANTELFENAWPEQESKRCSGNGSSSPNRKLRRKQSSRSSNLENSRRNMNSESCNDSPPVVVKAKACRTQNIDHVESQKSSSSSSDDGLAMPTSSSNNDSIPQSQDKNSELLSYVRFAAGPNNNNTNDQLKAPVAVPNSAPATSVVTFEIPPIEISDAPEEQGDELLPISAQQLNSGICKPTVCSSPLPSVDIAEQAQVFFSDSFNIDNEPDFEHFSHTVSAGGVSDQRRRTASEASCQSDQFEVAETSSLFGSFLSVAKSTVRAVASYASLSPGCSMADIEKGVSLRTNVAVLDRSLDSASSLDRSVLNEDLLAETEAQALQNMHSPEFGSLPDKDRLQSAQSRPRSIGGSTDALTTVQIQKDPAKICLSMNCDVQDNDELLRYLDKHRAKTNNNHQRVCNSASVDSYLLSLSNKQSLKLTDAIYEERPTSSMYPEEAVHKRPLAASAAVSIQSDGSTTSSNENVFVSSYMNFSPSSNNSNNKTACDNISAAKALLEQQHATLHQRSIDLAHEAEMEMSAYLPRVNDEACTLSDEEVEKAKEEEICSQRSPLHRFHSSQTGAKKDPFLSPLDATDDMLAQLPRCYLVACHLDPLLDDSIMFARKARKAGAKFVHVDLLDSLPHGFLNFTLISADCKQASKFLVKRIRQAFDTIPSSSPPPNSATKRSI